MRGTVKSFNDAKGWGFIRQPDGTEIFVHFSRIKGRGHKFLIEGEEVEYQTGIGTKGPEAFDVIRLGARPSSIQKGDANGGHSKTEGNSKVVR